MRLLGQKKLDDRTSASRSVQQIASHLHLSLTRAALAGRSGIVVHLVGFHPSGIVVRLVVGLDKTAASWMPHQNEPNKSPRLLRVGPPRIGGATHTNAQ